MGGPSCYVFAPPPSPYSSCWLLACVPRLDAQAHLQTLFPQFPAVRALVACRESRFVSPPMIRALLAPRCLWSLEVWAEERFNKPTQTRKDTFHSPLRPADPINCASVDRASSRLRPPWISILARHSTMKTLR